MEATATVQPIMRRSDYVNAIEDQVKLRRYYLTLLSPQSAESAKRQVAEHRAKAQQLLASADRIEAELASAKSLAYRTDAKIKQLREGMALLENEVKIKTISKLTDQLAELDPEALAAVMAALEAKVGGVK